jgi:hypothetical protein
MNASVQPDSTRAEKVGAPAIAARASYRRTQSFRDHEITTVALERLELMVDARKKEAKPFFLGVGFKLPHITYHMPRQETRA